MGGAVRPSSDLQAGGMPELFNSLNGEKSVIIA